LANEWRAASRRASSVANGAPASRGRVPASKFFFQTFPNLGLFSPRISKESFGGFVGFQGVTHRCKPKAPFSKFFVSWRARRARRAHAEPWGSLKDYESTVTSISILRKKNPREGVQRHSRPGRRGPPPFRRQTERTWRRGNRCGAISRRLRFVVSLSRRDPGDRNASVQKIGSAVSSGTAAKEQT
jgi:hypothetical protein